MQPQTSLIGQAAASMNQNAPALDQVSNSAPTAQPGMVAPQIPMPNHSFHIHKALQRRGIDPNSVAAQPQPNASGDVTIPTQAVQDDNPQEPGTQIKPTEAELLVKAITKRLDHHTKITEKLVDSFLPQINDWKNPKAAEDARAARQFGQSLRSGGGLTTLKQVSPNKYVDTRPSINQ